MNIAFTVRSIPELGNLSASEREALWQRCHPKAWRHWQTWVALALALGLFVAGFVVGVFGHPDGSLSWGRIFLGLLLATLGSSCFFPVQVAMTRRYILEELAD